MSKKYLVNLDLNGLSLLNPVLNPLATAPANANPYYIYTSTATSDKGTVYINVGTYASPSWSAWGAVKSVNGKIGVVTLTQDDVGNGSTYVRTHNDLTDALVTLINGALQKSGGTMSGAIAMGSNRITGLANGTADGDAVNKGQMEEAIRENAGVFRGTFATVAALNAVQWQTSDPTAANFVSTNDYAVVLADENHSNETWRYAWGVSNNTAQWLPQYRINETPLTQAQLDAINSGITSALVTKIGTNETAISQTRGMIAGTETTSVASKAYSVGDYLIYNNTLYRVTLSIAQGDTISDDVSTGNVTSVELGAEIKRVENELKVHVVNGTISTSGTSVTVNVTVPSGSTMNVLNAYAVQGGSVVLTDIEIGSSSVVFTIAQSASAEIKCYVAYILV